MNIAAVKSRRPHSEEAALRPSRRMAACSAVPLAILRDARPKGGLLRMRSELWAVCLILAVIAIARTGEISKWAQAARAAGARLD
jgi:hypothetical protein